MNQHNMISTFLIALLGVSCHAHQSMKQKIQSPSALWMVDQFLVILPSHPGRQRSTNSIFPVADTFIPFTLHRVKSLPGTMPPITPISTGCFLPGPSQAFGTSPLNSGTKRKNWEISVFIAFLENEIIQTSSLSSSNKSLPAERIRTRPSSRKIGKLEFRRSKQLISNST